MNILEYIRRFLFIPYDVINIEDRIHEIDNQDDGAFVIVEPRYSSKISSMIKDFSSVLPTSWTLYMFGSDANAMICEKIQSEVPDRAFHFFNLDEDLFVTQVGRMMDGHGYNKLLKKKFFWDIITEEHVLIFQLDSHPCDQSSQMIARFLKFGYIGCMFGHQVGPHANVPFQEGLPFYGIGGLSLRRKSFIMKCLEIYQDNCPHEAEDITFSTCVHVFREQYPVASVLDVGSFCAQGGWGIEDSPDSWGVHKFNETMPQNMKDKFLDYCPDASLT